ncbi:hypothetical protein CVT24_004081 [Panaeolus cyanescens]|uniref:N-acetyltransferase domain-containing protein n=1 Tax=Panaeolus cyanescens TaxID=181874 RepID=A0A409Y5U7_9AGAR|nr:hypothetical protein CVT24_004081 [Panaeolus cyanescens]
MSAYGHIQRKNSAAPLPPTTWEHEADSKVGSITVYHLTLESARKLPGLLEHLGTIFAKEVEDGMTYPQEGEMSQTTFETYFFSADVFLGLIGPSRSSPTIAEDGTAAGAIGDRDDRTNESLIEKQKGGKSWEECIAGFYYIKPNYPGRSSHVNTLRPASFASTYSLTPLTHCALLLRLWEKLGFSKAGLIPKAGRLRTKDGKGEEYVDAWVFYKSFIEA